MSRHIVTHFWAKPIPLRQFDWCAYYDGDEPNDNGSMPHGEGATEAAAVVDLIENYPRGVWCERVRQCRDCVHFHEDWSVEHDGSHHCDYRCGRWDRFVYSDGTCGEHYFAGGEPNTPPQPVVDEVPF